MKVGIIIEHNPLMKYIAEGFKKLGFSCTELKKTDSPQGYDFVTFWSMKKYEIVEKCVNADIPMLVAEMGFLGDREQNVSLGWNGINGNADFCNSNVNSERSKQWKNLISPWHESKEYILLLGQVNGDYTLKNIPLRLKNLYPSISKSLMKTYGLPVLFRPHPKWDCPVPSWMQRTTNKSLKEDLSKAYLAVAWSSNSLVDAVMSGTPALALDPISMAWDVAIHNIGETPSLPCRQDWLNKLAYSQWTLEELEQGLFWETLKEGLIDD